MSRMIKSGLTGIYLMAGFYVGISRISDYKHHPGDVLAGYIIGLLIGMYSVSNESYSVELSLTNHNTRSVID